MNCIFSVCVFIILLPSLASCLDEQIYIVYFGEPKGDNKALSEFEIEDHHLSYLLNVKENEESARESHIYSYKHSINGFAALLTQEEASILSELEEVVSVFKSRSRQLQTTRSWDFVGLNQREEGKSYVSDNQDLLKKAGYGEQIIVGVVDSGVWPESKSFSDEGMSPVPNNWKGICQTGTFFTADYCNKKIIGARYSSKGFLTRHKKINETEDYSSPRDPDGHGSHTASTVAGRVVHNVSAIGGYANGSASGGAPLARLAIYKACYEMPNMPKSEPNVCYDEDLLDAIDHAVADGVDILSISIAAQDITPYDEDAIAIGSLHAVKHNIVVAAAAGNNGPTPSTVVNVAPWIITVGASTIDREFKRSIVLGSGLEVEGYSTSPNNMLEMHSLVHAKDVAVPGVPLNVSGRCEPNTLSPKVVKGKIVFCLRDGSVGRYAKGLEVKRAGGVGMILGNTKNSASLISYDFHMLPATLVLEKDSDTIIQYISTTKNPLAIIKPGRTVFQDQPAPIMADFSSQGPNPIDPNILKPDVTAPGVNILAAWSGAASPTQTYDDPRRVEYNLYSGTSMATPHVAAAAVLLKAIHPEWSSAAIRSAIMTTAWTINNKNESIRNQEGNIATPFEYGTGHFSPTKAADPGLVYNASYSDYIDYLCSVGITKMDQKLNCTKSSFTLNYPSMVIPNLNGTATLNRTVTNVWNGLSSSIYSFTAKPPPGVSIEASPRTLCFDRVGQENRFSIKASGSKTSNIKKGEYVFGSYTWTDGYHIVTSPLAVSFA